MSVVRFLVLGGFLGSGKTTAILRLAQGHVAAGRRVGIIANDLGKGLVDTQTYLAHGLPVEEMAGVCFACRFDDLIAAAGRLQDGHQPDVLLAEPAGSCTDIVSRVVVPLKELYADRFHMAPYVTLLDPQRALEALGGKGPARFSAKVTYLYKMQQNEADVVAINKADTLRPDEVRTLEELVGRNLPQAEIIVVSARTGLGFDRLAALLEADQPAGRNPIRPGTRGTAASAAGDARLAWLNATWRLTAASPFDPDALLLDLAHSLQTELRTIDAEPAHVKMTLQSADTLALANLVGSDRPAELSQAAGASVNQGELTLNARVEAGLRALRHCVERALAATADRFAVRVTCVRMENKLPKLSDAASASS